MTSLRLDEIVARLGGELIGDGARLVDQVAPLPRATATEISFFADPKYRDQLATTRAAAVILHRDAAADCPTACIVCADPYLYFARAAQLLNERPRAAAGCHLAATVECDLPDSVTVGAGAYIGTGCAIGADSEIGPGCFIGAGTNIGVNALLHANVTIYPACTIGARAIIHSGAVIGADGFGFAREREGPNQGGWVKIPQIGTVIIGDDVEIGANTTIDRGAMDATVIEDGAKLDNLIQIAHNVHIGARSALAACVGIAGSTRIGRRCTIGGAAMIVGHLTIADDVHISAATVITKSISGPGIYTSMMPFMRHDEWRKNFAHVRHLEALAKKLRALEAQVSRLAQPEK